MTTSQPTPPPINATRPQPRFAPGPLGRGVFLSDLVRWLMKKHEATRVQVVKDYLCPVLLEKCPQLGFVQASGDTTSVLEREWYRSGSGNREAYIRTRSRGYGYIDGNLTHIPGDPIKSTKSMGKGTDGAVKWLQAFWGNARNLDAVMDHKDSLAAYLAVTEADARRCWGWRSADEAAPVVDAVAKPADSPTKLPTTWAELVAWPGRKATGFRWTDDLRLILATEKKRRTDLRHAGIAQAMGNELGCTGKNVNTLIAEMGKPGSREQMLGRAIASVSNGTNRNNGH